MDKKVVVSFSGGKDSMLSLHRVISSGYEPIALMTTINKNNGESWFHDISVNLLKQVSLAVNIPLLLVECEGDNYEKSFETALKNMKNLGAQGCVFGDIDIEHHRQWCEERCNNIDMKAIFPLWKENREKLVNEFLNLGYKAIIKKVDLRSIEKDFLGKTLNSEVIEKIKLTGADVCGENGEYHTFVYNGPIFSKEILLKNSKEIINENTLVLRLY